MKHIDSEAGDAMLTSSDAHVMTFGDCAQRPVSAGVTTRYRVLGQAVQGDEMAEVICRGLHGLSRRRAGDGSSRGPRAPSGFWHWGVAMNVTELGRSTQHAYDALTQEAREHPDSAVLGDLYDAWSNSKRALDTALSERSAIPLRDHCRLQSPQAPRDS